ncbi:Xaa-Pro peptidase family protein [bacterium]|nr:Xaa-Pro peptidase family protein [Patescibacteria group bacterium]MBU1627229.1 Xaa-Pro peptidase family protein [bacterium]MBU1934489.1 Xaa-Pro peptidase family protein [Patescibacteria group bacterium]
MRIQQIQKQIKKLKLGAVLISKPENVFYLCGFLGSNGQLFITPNKATLITDFRYFRVARKQLVKGVKVYDQKKGLKGLVGKIKIIGIEEAYITIAQLKGLKKALKGVNFKPTDYMVEKMRMIKDEEEMKIIKRGVKIMEKTLADFRKTMRVGQGEEEMSWKLLSIAKKNGAEGFSFPPIICFGKNTADVHHQVENNKLKKGEKVLVDFGIKYKNYCTDMTRVFYLYKSKGNGIEQKMYSTVFEANRAAIRAIKVGEKFSDIDKAARSVIKKAGYGKYFGHATGHGIGLKVHEHPAVSEASNEVVEPGMVFTIEPGIYIEGKGGIRIENMLYVSQKGKVEVLTKFEY